jgi:hypothetical protein
MNLRAHLLQLHVPGGVKNDVLDELFAVTAEAFDLACPATAGRPFDERLRSYAEFTRDAVEGAVAAGRDLPAIERRLFAGAELLGARVRTELGVRGTADVMAVARPLYRVIEIDLRGTARGDVTVDRCFFSRFYSPQVCRVISSLDAGLFAGLSGGGRLVFVQRITEGHDCCLARFAPEESAS